MAKPPTFRDSVEKIPSLRFAHKEGLQALKGEHRELVSMSRTRDFLGSADLDEALAKKKEHRAAHRWDYAIGYATGNTENVVFVEVHGATESEVSTMLSKLEWLRSWLGSEGKPLGEVSRPRGFVWLATSSGVKISKGSRHARRIAKAGLSMPTRRLLLP